MKNLIIIMFFVCATVVLFSCKKAAQNPAPPPAITGQWDLMSDSAYNTVFPSWDGIYIGKSTDRYNFEPNGKLSWYENGAGTDSAAYSLASGDKSLTIHYFPNKPANSCNCTVTYNISVITDHKLVLLSLPYYAPTQGVFYAIMTFTR